MLTSLLCGGQHWVTERGAFQKKLLARMRGLGMTAVLSSFSGHIPKAFADKHPEAKIRRSPNWGLQQRIFLSLLCQRSDVGQVWLIRSLGAGHMPTDYNTEKIHHSNYASVCALNPCPLPCSVCWFSPR